MKAPQEENTEILYKSFFPKIKIAAKHKLYLSWSWMSNTEKYEDQSKDVWELRIVFLQIFSIKDYKDSTKC